MGGGGEVMTPALFLFFFSLFISFFPKLLVYCSEVHKTLSTRTALKQLFSLLLYNFFLSSEECFIEKFLANFSSVTLTRTKLLFAVQVYFDSKTYRFFFLTLSPTTEFLQSIQETIAVGNKNWGGGGKIIGDIFYHFVIFICRKKLKLFFRYLFSN